MSQSKLKRFTRARLPFHVMIGLSAALGASTVPVAALAQDDADDGDDDDEGMIEEVVVTGVRGSLMSSQDLKQNSDVFVDAVTAEDIGALPDRSVNEVLQRIPGVAITRFAGANDPDHFSVEGSGTIVRGLSFVRSELNGRDVFTADSGQALGFNTVSPELMQSVQVFKNQSSDMIEGGIGGTVNLITRKPFDSPEQVLAFSVEANYGDLIEEWTPGASILWSNRWDLDSGGEFGLLFSAAYSELEARADGTLVAEWLDRVGDGTRVPSGAGIRTQLFNRERIGFSGAAQWVSPDGEKELLFEFFNSSYTNDWNEFNIEPSIDDGPGLFARPGTSWEFGSDGLFERGILTNEQGWGGPEPSIPTNGIRQLTQSRRNTNESETSDISLNFRWAPTAQWSTNFDIQYIDSTVEVEDYSTQQAIWADTVIDLSGEVPTVGYLPPTGQPDDYFTDPTRYYTRSIMDHLEDSEGNETAFRADAEYDFSGDSWLRSMRFGARYAEREQTVRYAVYNWGNVSEIWNSPFLLSNAPDLFGPFGFDNYQRMGVGPNAMAALFYQGGLDRDSLLALANLSPTTSWVPLDMRDGVVPGTPFLPGEINEVNQDTGAAYIRFDFGWDSLGGSDWGLDGNIGVRYVRTDQSAAGGIVYPNRDSFLGGDTLPERCTPEAPGESVPGFCQLPPDQQAQYLLWADGSSVQISDDYDYDNWLPSLNLRLGYGANHQFRLGLSQSIYRPDFGLLKSNFLINFGDDDPLTGEWLGPDTDTSQVRLDPIKSSNFDLSYEWYFADIGSLTLSIFYKDLEDFHVPAVTEREFDNNGVSWPVLVNGTGNAEDSGEIKGYEITYQQVYDMLPGFFQYFGVQANYTYIDTEGVPNIGTDNVSGTGTGSAPNFDVSGLGLPGLSEDTANLVVFWENDTVSARVAYNYRSEYVLTQRDVIYPFTPIVHGDTGQLDASIFWNFTDNLQVGVQGVNLTDEITETYSVFNEDYDQGPRSFFRNDRRYAIILRGNF
ncbi:MAG: TonB-dependent receptor [Pseudomonadota bacterium]